MCWFVRDAWWKTRRTATVGSADLVGIECWLVPVRPGTHSTLWTATFARSPPSTQCFRDSINDGEEATEH